jgi:hypothetical protein
MTQVEVLEQVLVFVTPPELARAACVAREWRTAAACPRLWRAALATAFGQTAVSECVSEWSCRKAAGGIPESAREPVYPALGVWHAR